MTGPPLDAGGRLAPATLAWLSSVRAFAVEVASGNGQATHDHTSGRVEVSPNPGDLATACWNGDLRLDTTLAATLDEVFTRPALRRDADVLAEQRRACFVALHEFLHLQTGEFQQWVVSEHRYADGNTPAYRALEEGVTDLVTARSFTAMVERTGLDTIAPGIADVEVGDLPYGYPRFAHAAQTLVARAAEATGVSETELLTRLTAQNAPGKWESLGALVSGSAPGADDVLRISSRRSGAAAAVTQAMTSVYGRIGNETGAATTRTDLDNADDVAAATIEAGRTRAAEAVERARRSDRPRWRSRYRAAVPRRGVDR